jgi:3-deoxy-manno-octulosonate cytidylyltransferase (CMP-KDO synthetase)
MEQVLIIIPARLKSSRLDQKLLIEIAGKSVIRRTWERARSAKRSQRVIVAVDDERLLRHVKEFGGEAMLTSRDHESGTDRCAEVAAKHEAYDLIVNVQGDEPLIDPRLIDDLIRFTENGKWDIATAAHKLNLVQKVDDPNLVKVVKSRSGRAMYFSRAPIPYIRDRILDDRQTEIDYWGHTGIYAFRRNVLLDISRIPESVLAKTEKLEQLAWLDSDYSVGVMETRFTSRGLDSMEDLAYLENQFNT